MLHLITGTNGAGKTLNALKWVYERAEKESRPVCHNGRFKPVEGGKLSTWKEIDIKNWQDEPDGTIFLVDECHNDFPVRPSSAQVPEYVRMLAEHRRRGMDFYLITQHPLNIDTFIRRLIGSPGWHRHIKRVFGSGIVSILEWNSVNTSCEKDGAGKSGQVTTAPFPKEVFTWYESATLHTGQKKIPAKIYVLILCLLLIPLLIWYAFSKFSGKAEKAQPAEQAQSVQLDAKAPQAPPGPPQLDPLSVEYYIKQRAPRLPELPHTAPAYDEVTRPVRAPYPAACVTIRGNCKCYTQQATVMQVSENLCRQIVKHGFFVDWDTAAAENDRQPQRETVSTRGHAEQPSPGHSIPGGTRLHVINPIKDAKPQPFKQSIVEHQKKSAADL